MNIEHLNPAQAILESLNYVYDGNGNRTSMNRPAVNLPLPSTVSNTSYNSANQMLQFNAKNMIYDQNGNMTSVTNSCGTTSYAWDARNRLVGIDGYKPDCSPLTASFKYDALSRRIEKTINGKTTQYLYDGLDIVQEIENGFVSANYVRTLNIDEPMARIKSDGTMRYYHQDALGSGIALTDETGALKTTYSYDPFGNTIISGETSDNPFQYTVIENDETGLYYYRARYYSPELQRFISEDPIGLAGGINQFTYVGNNPVNFVDPLGLTWESNWNFFWDWVFERGPAQRYYGPNTTETQEMMRSPGATNMRNTFKKGRCKNIRIEAYGKDYFGIESYIENLADPGSTGFQVGGFIYSATNNGNGTVTYRIYNQASIFSFFLHIPGLPHKPRGGSLPFMGNINQKFEWSEATPCGCK